MKILTVKSNLMFKSKEEKEFKKELKNEMGNPKSLRFYIRYVQGIKEIDISEEIKDPLTLMVDLYKYEKGISFKIEKTGIVSWILALSNDEVEKVYFVDGEEIIHQKNVVGRSAAGALIAGPIGAIVGGMSGLGEVKLQETFIVIKTEGCKLIFKCGIASKEKIEREFKKIFNDKVITTEEVKRQQEQEFLNSI